MTEPRIGTTSFSRCLVSEWPGNKAQGDWRMNKNRLLIAAAAVALIVGSNGAIAQQERGGRVGPTGAIHENGRPAAHSGGAAQHEGGAGINRSEPAGQRS